MNDDAKRPIHKYQVYLYLKVDVQIRANTEDEIQAAVYVLNEGLFKNDLFLECDIHLPLEESAHYIVERVETGEIRQTG